MNINTAEINECISNQFKAVATDERVQRLQRIAEIGDRLNELEEMYGQIDKQLDYPDDLEEIELLRAMLRKINIEMQDLCAKLEDYEKQEQFKFESELYGVVNCIDDVSLIPLKGAIDPEGVPAWDWVSPPVYQTFNNMDIFDVNETRRLVPESRVDESRLITPERLEALMKSKKGFAPLTLSPLPIFQERDGCIVYGFKRKRRDIFLNALEAEELELPDESEGVLLGVGIECMCKCENCTRAYMCTPDLIRYNISKKAAQTATDSTAADEEPAIYRKVVG